jgi:hypothetical protein
LCPSIEELADLTKSEAQQLLSLIARKYQTPNVDLDELVSATRYISLDLFSIFLNHPVTA